MRKLTPIQRATLAKLHENNGHGFFYSSVYLPTLYALERRQLIELDYGGNNRFGGKGHYTAVLTSTGRELAARLCA